MSLRRLVATTLAMAATALLLAALTADLAEPAALVDPQAVVDEAGPEALLVAAVGLSAWVAWGWGALGLVLTALSAAPGVAGGLARGAGRLVLPASARRAAAVALGVGLTAVTPVLAACSPSAQPVAAVESLPSAAPVPDWPTSAAPPPSAGTAPDWPAEELAGEHVVIRGDCLWAIAAADLRTRTGAEPAAPDVVRAVAAWWASNRDLIGPDPDLLLPGQVLRAPAVPTVTGESENRP